MSPTVRVNQEKLELKEPEVLKETEAWMDRREHLAPQVTSASHRVYTRNCKASTYSRLNGLSIHSFNISLS